MRFGHAEFEKTSRGSSPLLCKVRHILERKNAGLSGLLSGRGLVSVVLGYNVPVILGAGESYGNRYCKHVSRSDICSITFFVGKTTVLPAVRFGGESSFYSRFFGAADEVTAGSCQWEVVP